jgi:hypothetical protein
MLYHFMCSVFLLASQIFHMPETHPLQFPLVTTSCGILSQFYSELCFLINYKFMYTVDRYFLSELVFGFVSIHWKYNFTTEKAFNDACPFKVGIDVALVALSHSSQYLPQMEKEASLPQASVLSPASSKLTWIAT